MSFTLTYLKQQGAKSPAMQKVVDNVLYNVALGALGMAWAQSDPNNPRSLVNPDVLEKISKSWGNDATIVKQLTNTPTVVNSRTFTVTHTQGSSSLVAVNMGYIGFSVRVLPANFLNSDGGELNMVSLAEHISRELGAGMNSLRELLDAAVISALQTTKTKVLQNPLDYQFTADTVVATAAQRRDALIMRSTCLLIQAQLAALGVATAADRDTTES
jgi:hypothetical protein